LKREPDKIARELEKRLRADLAHKGDFAALHPLPQSGGDVPDDYDARLVVIGTRSIHTVRPRQPGRSRRRAILSSAAAFPRLFQNTLVFLAADRPACRISTKPRAATWPGNRSSMRRKGLNLDPQQVQTGRDPKGPPPDGVVTARLPETYQWLLVPVQATPQSPLTWQSHR
jgi:hypothetical protein